jgi:hypothetical protein
MSWLEVVTRLYFGRGGRGRLGGGPGQGGNCEGRWAGMLIECVSEDSEILVCDIGVPRLMKPV